ncbi:MAG: nucleoside triphosphate pyrophosphohydrolase family protein [Alphaproteobacteria bacterium]|nr:nucleoside triphosphate pyrophosphohydrolase family protein [Alphaproteobacteria bacterium]
MNEIKDFLSNYCKSVDSVTSENSRNDRVFFEQMQKLSAWLNGNYSRMDTAMTGLAGEVGECCDLWKKLKFQGKDLSEENRQKLIDELGDVCWYLSQAAMALGIGIEEIIEKNMQKIITRYPNGFSPAHTNK